MSSGGLRLSVHAMAYAAVGVALLAVSSWITVTLSTVPFTLQTFAVVLVMLVMSPSLALFTIALYLAAGAAGLPVFAGMTGGLATLMGPYGGYLVGFLAGSTIACIVMHVKKNVATEIVGALCVVAASHALGVAWLAATLDMAPFAAFSVGSLQFLLPDLAKCALALLVAHEVVRAVPRVSTVTLGGR